MLKGRLHDLKRRLIKSLVRAIYPNDLIKKSPFDYHVKRGFLMIWRRRRQSNYIAVSLYLQGFLILPFIILLSFLLLKVKVNPKIGVNLLVYVINHRLFLPFQTDDPHACVLVGKVHHGVVFHFLLARGCFSIWLILPFNHL